MCCMLALSLTRGLFPCAFIISCKTTQLGLHRLNVDQQALKYPTSIATQLVRTSCNMD